MGSATLLPGPESPDLHLSQPTPEECTQIWSTTAASWKDSLTVPLYIAEAQYLATVPLARDEGVTRWVLIFCSCESFRKRCLASDERGNVEEGVVHGIASVFCPPEYRGRGYGTRHMRELAEVLRGWQSERYGKSTASVLYSDVGKEYYARVGWLPTSRNGHFVFPCVRVGMEKPALARLVSESELGILCSRDEAIVRSAMATPGTVRKRVVILPDLDHMLWHIRKEDFAVDYIFGGKKAEAKGAIAGSPGKQVWAVWVRRYYGHPDRSDEEGEEEGGNGNGNGNVLYILRLVVEGDDTANRPHESRQLPPAATDAYVDQAAALKAVIQAAQAEAAKWRLGQVKLWEPSPLVQSLLEQSDLGATRVERQESSIASVLWFREDGVGDDEDEDEAPVWVNNEYYAWC
ncbi:hypothetical protein F5Y14DRAFT_443834 [Nemania sp. NC0429]|nr:hypothetical protein F5Y14DRAFT_443834 [Nemania sp. NC0429]